MLIEESQRRQNELKQYIFEMSDRLMEDSDLRKMAIQLKTLYSSGFRHSYSEFFPCIVEISKDDNVHNLEYLSNNLVALQFFVEKDYLDGNKEFSSLHIPLTKLIDHLNLEIARYNSYSISEQKVKDLEKRNSTLQSDLKQATEQLEAARKQVSSVQAELITVLSIFAAIVLAFSGGINYMGTALTGMAEASLFKSILFVSLCGVVLFNTIFMLMYFIAKITGRSIYAPCNSDCNQCRKKCNDLNKIRKRLPYVFWVNALLLIIIIIDIVFWALNLNYWHLCF